MEPNDLDMLLRVYAEPLQYVAFFAVLVLLGAWEALAPGSRQGSDRRRRWPANGGLTVLNILVLAAIPLSGIAAADVAMARGWGLLNLLPVPVWGGIVAGVLLRSFLGYGIHVAMHKVPLLWRVHRVHHTDVEVDISTTVRFHPLEFAIATPILLAGVVAFGIPAVALILYEILDAAMAVVTHANIRLPATVDRPLSFILVTPAMHRVHHSISPRETDSNYGATFAFWDRLFGTYRRRSPDDLAAMQVGLTEWRDRRTASLAWLLALPFHRMAAASLAASANRGRTT